MKNPLEKELNVRDMGEDGNRFLHTYCNTVIHVVRTKKGELRKACPKCLIITPDWPENWSEKTGRPLDPEEEWIKKNLEGLDKKDS